MSLKTPTIAILLAAYNGIEFIEEQVDTILKQKYVIVDLFISVDLSSDGTYEWALDLSLKNKNVHVLPYGDVFGIASKNFYRLIKDVDFGYFDYIALADQDDIWMTDKIINAIDMLKLSKAVGYSGNTISFWDNGRRKKINRPTIQKKFDYYFEPPGPGCTFVIKKEIAIILKDFVINNWIKVNDVHSHDWFIYAFIRSKGQVWNIDNREFMLYRQHEKNQEGARHGLKAYLSRVRMIKNGWYVNEIKKIYGLVFNKDSFSLSRWFLIRNFYQLRRSNADTFFLLFMLLIGIF